MNQKQAAEIIKTHVATRDTEAAKNGKNSSLLALRRVGDAVSEADEDIATDVLAGRGSGSESAGRRIIRVAKKIS